MYFGSTNGLCYFTPSNILEKRQSPKATIGKITIFEPLVSENSNETEISLINKESVQLKYLQNSFNISFNIQDYSLNERVEYAYMLKGLENLPSAAAFSVLFLQSVWKGPARLTQRRTRRTSHRNTRSTGS